MTKLVLSLVALGLSALSLYSLTRKKILVVDSAPSYVKNFFAKHAPYAFALEKRYGLPAKTLLAQSALETGYGRDIIDGTNNLFNIKASSNWTGGTKTTTTDEYKSDGTVYTISARFKAYENIHDSFEDYARLVQTKRYINAYTARNNENEYIKRLASSGYATDPNYATKVISVRERFLL